MFTIHINNRFKSVAVPTGAYDNARDVNPAPAMLNMSGFSERASAVD